MWALLLQVFLVCKAVPVDRGVHRDFLHRRKVFFVWIGTIVPQNTFHRVDLEHKGGVENGKHQVKDQTDEKELPNFEPL